MIKFFRKIRQKLLAENSFSKYLLYAIGEILLVMIGILLALQVNQWNDEKKDRQIENTALLNLRKEFEKNIMNINRLAKTRLKREDEYRTYLTVLDNDTIPPEEKVKRQLPYLPNGYLNPTNTALKSLMNTGYIDKIKNDSLKTLLIKWTKDITMISLNEQRVLKASQEQKEYLKKHIYQPIVKQKRREFDMWPGTSLSKNSEDKNKNSRASLIQDIVFFNTLSNSLSELYRLNSYTNYMRNKAEIILKLIDKELKTRKVAIEN
ncbi:hypothetical protein [Seonamhaeicola maritimus]|uniref:Uncharacterized protein n=1 Tax=Seonamhaeicola maritimus TaxID=2591822 RepID=A0A5C7GK16_9FLAO|nr:hypothetical protein [Seonamhaeicola maritimus]TXG38718.1 hypothetical protein FUA22_02195 [Seonamhaeicola maritimus]